MSDSNEVRFTLKVLINKEKTKVLIALVDSDFADVLLSFFALPLGTIVRILKKHYGDQTPTIGSLNTLYNGLVNLNSAHFFRDADKQLLLNPISSLEQECRKLKLNVDDTHPSKYFICENRNCDSDDLRMVPNVTGSIMQCLDTLGITDTDGAEETTFIVGFNEIMDLLKGSLFSQSPLTNLILHKNHMHHSPTSEFQSVNSQHCTNSKKMILTAMVQKSTNKFLFVQAEEDFVEFLFSFFTIPFGKVESLLGSNTSLGSIDNLYRSIASLKGDEYLITRDTKDMLIEPKLPAKFLSSSHMFPLTEKVRNFFICSNEDRSEYYVSTTSSKKYVRSLQVENTEGQGRFVKGKTMFMVTDDLTVTPLCMFSSLSTLKRLKISTSDVKEIELQIGSEEALCILKASLASTCALTRGLITFLKNNQNKNIEARLLIKSSCS